MFIFHNIEQNTSITFIQYFIHEYDQSVIHRKINFSIFKVIQVLLEKVIRKHNQYHRSQYVLVFQNISYRVKN